MYMHLIIAILCNETLPLQSIRGHEINSVWVGIAVIIVIYGIASDCVGAGPESYRNGDNKNKSIWKSFPMLAFSVYCTSIQKST